MIKYFIAIIALLASPVWSDAAVLFSDNFDSYTWNTTGTYDGTECYVGTCSELSGTGWDYFRANEAGVPSPIVMVSTPPAGTDHTTGSGHSLVTRWGTEGYNGDSVLLKRFSSAYTDLWIGVWVKTQVVSASGEGSKFLRVQFIDNGFSNAFDNFVSGNNAPIGMIQLNQTSGYGRKRMMYRCDPQATNYYCTTSEGVPNDDTNWYWNCSFPTSCSDVAVGSLWGDGNWHYYKIHAGMNSSLNASDGIFDIWYDGTLISSEHDVKWRLTGANATGWNSVALGGNTDELSAARWAAYDDIVIATTEADLDSGGSPATHTMSGASISGGSLR